MKIFALGRAPLRIGSTNISRTPVDVDITDPKVLYDLQRFKGLWSPDANALPYANVIDFGAKRDGVTDDATAIQKAINSFGTGAGRVFLPRGSYLIKSTITTPTNGLILEGEGFGSRILFDGSILATAIASPDTTQRIGIWVKDIRISSKTANTGLAIDASYWAISGTENLHIDGPCNQGILHNSVLGDYNHDINPRIAVGGVGGFGIKYDNSANENTVTRARIITADANVTGVIVNSSSNSLYDVDVETGAAIGIDIQASGHAATIYSPYLEANAINLRLASGVQQVMLIGGTIESGSTADIQDNGAAGFINQGCRVAFSAQPLKVSMGSTPQDAIFLDTTNVGGTSQLRDSHNINLRSNYTDAGSVQHTIDWRIVNNASSNTGGSKLRFMSRQDSATMTERFSVDGSGVGIFAGRVQLGGPVQHAINTTAKTGAYSISATADDTIICNTTSGVFAVTLPTAANIQGRVFTIKRNDSSANALTVNTTSSQTIDGATSKSLSALAAITVVSDGSNWLILNTFGTVT